MPLSEAILQALQTAWSHKLRSFFTLLGIIVSVGFLVAVVAVIQGMNAYVRERIAGAIVGVNAFQIRRDPIQVGFIDDEEWKKIQRRPIIAPEDVAYVERAVPDAQAISLQSGWPTPMADVQWRNRTVGDVLVFGVTPPFVVVQDYAFAAGAPFTDVDQRQRRLVAVLGFDVADKLFGAPELAIGSAIRVRGAQLIIKGVIAKKGTVLFRDARALEHRTPGGRDRGNGDHDGVRDQPHARDRLAQGDGRDAPRCFVAIPRGGGDADLDGRRSRYHPGDRHRGAPQASARLQHHRAGVECRDRDNRIDHGGARLRDRAGGESRQARPR